MSGNPREDNSSGQLTRAATGSVGPAAVDCAGWDADAPAEQWSSGKLVSIARSQSTAETAFTPTGSLDMEIALRIGPEVDPARAFAAAAQLVAEVLGHDPGLGLVYNPARCSTEDGRVVIVLTAGRRGPDVEARLEEIAAATRKAAVEAGGIALNEVRILRAA
jgi:hypothetical protein